MKPTGSARPASATPQPIAARPSPYRADNGPGEKNIVETAAVTGSFKTLGAAIRAGGLVDQLSGKGPFTVFAPTDAAFARVPKADLDVLFKDKARLAQVIRYHVVSSIVKAPKLGTPRSPTTMNGANLEIVAKNGGFQVNDAKVVRTEILASNGVIHAIDTLLMPR
jgi:uncharacterized surface protein with fasciclin (FAS1) repeats